MKIDIHILTNSAGLISDTAGVKSPEGEYSPPVSTFSNLLQSTIDNNTPQNKNLNTKNSTSIENSIGAIQVEESLSSLRIATEPTSSTVQQTENVFETALQNSNTIGIERKEYSVNDGQKNVKLSQRINNIQDKDVATQNHLTYSTIENNSTNAIDEFRYHNEEHIKYPLQTKENVVQTKISAQNTAKEKFIEIESMIRDFSDSMKVQTKGKVHINILPSHIDDVQVRVDISHAANDEIPQIMEMIIQNLWIPMQQKNQQSGINNIEDSLTVQYEHTRSENNFEQILRSESENTSYDNIQLNNQTPQYHNTLNLNTKVHSVSSEHKMYSQVATDFDADSALESSHRSKQNSVIHEYKQENSDYSVELHSDIAEKQMPVLTQNQETLSDNIFDETENAHQTSHKTTNNSQNDEIALFNQSGFNKKPSKQLESNFPHESVQGKSTPSEKLEYINSSNRKLSTSPLSVNSDLQNNALQSYITTLFPEPSNNVENMTDNEDIQILKNIESSRIANMSDSSGNHSILLENSDKPFLVNNAVQERKKTVVNEYILNANEKNSPSLDVKNNNKEQLQKYEQYREQGEVAEIYVHNDNVNINSTKELNTTNTEILYHELQDSRKTSSDVNESDIVQSETEGGDIQNEILERKLPKTINSSQDNIERNTINIESETLDGNLFELNNSIVSHGKNHPSYSKDSSSLNHRNDNVINRTSEQDLEQGTIEKNGLYDVKSHGGKVHDNASNDKTINENNKQEHLPTIKQSALNVTMSENEDDYNNAETNVPLHLNNNLDNEILGIQTKKIVTNKSVHSNSGEVEKLHSIVDIKNIDSDNITKDNVGLDETSILPKKISPNTTLNDELFNKSAEDSVNLDNYTIKEKKPTSGNTNIGLANKIQNRVSEEVILSTELEENSLIQGEKQRTTVSNGVEQRDNPVIRKNSNLNLIQYQKSVVDSDDVSVNKNVQETKSIEQKPETSTSRTSKSDQDLQSEKLDFVNESKEIEKSHSEQQKTTLKSAVDQSNNPVMIKRSSVNPIENTLFVEADDNSSNVVPNQSKINKQNSEKSISHISQNDQDLQLVKVDFVNESKEIEKAHSEQQKTILNDAANQSDSRVMMQSPNRHPNKNEKIVNITQDASTNIQEGEVVKSVNTTLHKPDSFSENSQLLQDSDIYRTNDETIENRTSHSQLIRSRSVKDLEVLALLRELLLLHGVEDLLHRPDLGQLEDLLDEDLRAHGLDHLPVHDRQRPEVEDDVLHAVLGRRRRGDDALGPELVGRLRGDADRQLGDVDDAVLHDRVVAVDEGLELPVVVDRPLEVVGDPAREVDRPGLANPERDVRALLVRHERVDRVAVRRRVRLELQGGPLVPRDLGDAVGHLLDLLGVLLGRHLGRQGVDLLLFGRRDDLARVRPPAADAVVVERLVLREDAVVLVGREDLEELENREGVLTRDLLRVPALGETFFHVEGRLLRGLHEGAVLLLAEAGGELLDVGHIPERPKERVEDLRLHADREEAHGRVCCVERVGVLPGAARTILRDGFEIPAGRANRRRRKVRDLREVLGNRGLAADDLEAEKVVALEREDEAADRVALHVDLDPGGARDLPLECPLERRGILVEVLREEKRAAGLFGHRGEERSIGVVAVLDEGRRGDLARDRLDRLQDLLATPLVVAAVRHEEHGEGVLVLLRDVRDELRDQLDRLLEARQADGLEPAVDRRVDRLEVGKRGDRFCLEQDAALTPAAEPDHAERVLFLQQLRDPLLELLTDTRKVRVHRARAVNNCDVVRRRLDGLRGRLRADRLTNQVEGVGDLG
jgi:hypothetical protein